MTLILTIANERGVHQSSDYQLTDPRTGDPITDEAGSKQLDAMIPTSMSIQLAFTGVARVTAGGRIINTREWLQSELQALPPKSDLQTICDILAKRCARQMKPLTPKGELTLVLAVAEIGQPFRVAVISNAQTKKTQFDIQVRTVKKPFHLISGYRDAVPEIERHRLKALARDTEKSPGEIRKALAAINAIAAWKSKGWISEECWIGSQFADGALRRIETHAFGQVGGTIPQLVGGLDMLQWVKDNFQAAPGQEIQLHPLGAVMAGPGGATLLPPPQGAPRTFTLSGGSIAGPLRSPAGTHCASLKMTMLEGGITARRNQEATGPFAEIELTRVSMCDNFAQPLLPWPQAKLSLFLDGVEVPRGWEQTFGHWVEEGIQRVSILRTSRGIRNLAFLADDEELIIVVNENELVLKPNEERADATLTAAVQWRTRMDGTRG